ncbi:DNA mismatch repair protein MutS [Candidatus Synechococcus calcipolaris G9]|uniref:DNA mismatch repair protein MutS n=1 Tax=Candidatus Synechococcus calcipolaris G9 TaxID=1497997 RepID=A0ABT6EWQ0_9SYNE|nr:DNA mismatch repair protein MutS [Candidatus Synechococcus calcipolaris]MDG2990204.1 DNA mismatch repair protein MutS [Candidatus Synechococcus calcipolaris G9]
MKTNDTHELPLRLGRNPGLQIRHDEIDRQQLTPMLQHYADIKDQHPHTLLLYRVGDFYETFFQDACTIARELELVLTGKEGGKDVGRVAMAGVPHHALERYCRSLVEKGYAIAICDQVEDPAQAQGLVKREVTRVFTPGTVLDAEMLQPRRNNFLAAVVIAGTHWGLAYADVSTGEFRASQGSDRDQLAPELTRLQPSEILFPSDAPDPNRLLRPGEGGDILPQGLPSQFCYTLRSPADFSQSEARQRLLQTFKLRSLEGLGCETLHLATRAAGGLLTYLEETHREQTIPLQPLSTYHLSHYLFLDSSTRRNLELTQTSREGSYHGSLLWAIDRTVTAMGGRLLRRWLLQPLLDLGEIQARQGAIQELMDQPQLRQVLNRHLQNVYDLERLAGRAGSGSANARDLAALRDSFRTLLDLSTAVVGTTSPFFQTLATVPPALDHLGERLYAALVESPPMALMEGGMIRPGASPELDQQRQQLEQDQQWFLNLETQERQRTGISTLKVGFTKVAGYYISVSRAKAQNLPEDYLRKQTLTNEERYITTELKEREARLFSAQTALYQLEYEIFLELRQQVAEQASVIREVAAAVAAVDVLLGLAEVAIYQGYVCPALSEDRQIHVHQGRHPVVEQSLPVGFFVPNDTHLGGLADLMILTGPNASGKSCYLRQVGLIQLLAQMGSFVPAQGAQMALCDRIFTRVGAVDDLATGQSTFMVEMNETANILNHASDRSLVLLDEIGRGTATFDGLAIAWAVAEYLAVTLRARTIFATHYHELNELAMILTNVANYQVVVKELPDEIIFLHQVQPGGADRSYGIEAGRLAGLPAEVIQRARQVMAQIEKHSKIAVGLRKSTPKSTINATVDSPADSSKIAQGELNF